MFQQAGASLQLQRRPLTKDLVWKNDVTALNERKMEGRWVKGVVTAHGRAFRREMMQQDRRLKAEQVAVLEFKVFTIRLND